MEIYISIAGTRAIAGHHTLTAITFDRDINLSVISLLMEKPPHYDWEKIETEIKNLSGFYKHESVTIPVIDINTYGKRVTHAKYTQKAIALLMLKNSLSSEPTLIHNRIENPGLFSYKNQRQYVLDEKYFISHSISQLSFKRNILIESKKYPIYNWQNNLGMPTDEHMFKLIVKGPVKHLHKQEVIHKTCKYVLKRYITNPKQYWWFYRYLYRPPKWWRRYTTVVDYYACLSSKERQVLKKILKTSEVGE